MPHTFILSFFILVMGSLTQGHASHQYEQYYTISASDLNQLQQQAQDSKRNQEKAEDNQNALENLQARLLASRFFPYLLEYRGENVAVFYKKIYDHFKSSNYFPISDSLINFALRVSIPETPIGDTFSNMSYQDMDKLLDDHLQKTSGFQRMFSYWGNDFMETLLSKVNPKMKNTSFSKNPIQQISEKIDIIHNAFLETKTLERISHKETKKNDFPPENSTITKDMAIPKTSEMIVNLSWIKKEKDNDPNGLLFPREYQRNQVEIGQKKTINIVERLNEWAEQFPRVVFWYDGKLVSDGSVERTQAFIQKNCSHHEKIELRDIRSLAISKEVTDAFNHSHFDLLPPYVRSDWFRLLASYDQVKNANTWIPGAQHVYSVYADLSIPPILPEAITKDKLGIVSLNTYGFVLSQTSGDSFENNFHIFNNDKDIIESLNLVYGKIFPQLLLNFMDKKYPFDKPLSQYHTGERTLSDSVIHSHLFNFYSFIRHKKGQGTWERNGQKIEDAIKDPNFINSGDCYKWFFSSTIPHNLNAPNEKFSTFTIPGQLPESIEYATPPTLSVLAPDSNH